MRTLSLFVLLVLLSKVTFSQVESRISINSYSTSINTGQNYSPLLNDNLNDLVASVWTPINQQYIDVTLPLERKSRVSKVSLYDYQGVFATQPAYIYALNGTQKTLLGIFTGETYLNWVNIIRPTPVLADAIIIHKFGNNIPQKIKVFGFPEQVQAVINFPSLTDKTVGDAPFNLIATSNNTGTPITFTSSNSSIISVSNASGVWKGTVVAVGTATITASQAANTNYTAAANVSRTQAVQAGSYQVLPGKIEAESYYTMSGILTEATGDIGEGQNVGYVDDGDWIDYKVNVASGGNYALKLRIASITNTGIFELKTVGGSTLCTVNLPNTGGWQTYNTVSTSISLSAGQQTLRIYAKKGKWNLNWFEVVSAYKAVPGKVEAESYDAMFDYVWQQDTQDAGGGQFVSGLDDNDWLDYNISVAATGTYIFKFRVTTANNSGKLEIKKAAGITLNSLDIPNTGGWNTWLTINTTALLVAGNQTIRIYAKKGGWNINWFEVVSTYQTQSVISFTALADKTVGDAPFNLVATSNNMGTPITFTSSNPSVVSLSNTSGTWKGTIVAAGTAEITASQVAGTNFTAAASVTRTQSVQAGINNTITGKIPINYKYWYQLNSAGDGNTANTGFIQLTDGIINEQVIMGYGKILSNYDSYYDFKDLSNVSISKIRMYNGYGSFEDKPFKLYAKSSPSATPILLANFVSVGYGNWMEVNLPTPIEAQYLVVNSGWGFPDEIELYGSYRTKPINLFPSKEVRFGDMLGVNSFVWDFLQNSVDPNLRDTIYEPKMVLMQAFTQYRDYVDWEKIEPSKGNYTFNPTVHGSWNYDRMYKRLKQEGKTVLACLKTLPSWFLQNYYPPEHWDSENVPAPFNSNLLAPNSYILQAKLAFQFSARYGSNKNIDMSLLSGVITGPVYPTAPEAGIRTREVGLDVIKYVECENERDKWWKGRKAYQTAREYAANLSAFYDGHKNTMGAGVGAKNADSNMKVVIGGIASTSTDYIRGIIDWCKEFRGYHADGSVNLCFDVINYHSYSFQAGGSQYGNTQRGAAPEIAGSGVFATDFSNLGREYNIEVWITEGGYDVNEHSPIHAPAIGNKSALEVQADWILRTALLYARTGIKRMFFYQTYDENINSWGQFGSSGLLDDIIKKRKPAADYLFQTKNLLGNFIYKETINSAPIVDRYEWNGKSAYALVVPNETNRTVQYVLDLENAAFAYIYKPKVGSDTMIVTKVATTDGKILVTVTETPLFIMASPEQSAAITSVESNNSISDNQNFETKYSSSTSFEIYPNPTSGSINIVLNNKDKSDIKIRISSMSSGQEIKTYSFSKTSNPFFQRLDLSQIPTGEYIIEAYEGNDRKVRKLLKIK